MVHSYARFLLSPAISHPALFSKMSVLSVPAHAWLPLSPFALYESQITPTTLAFDSRGVRRRSSSFRDPFNQTVACLFPAFLPEDLAAWRVIQDTFGKHCDLKRLFFARPHFSVCVCVLNSVEFITTRTREEHRVRFTYTTVVSLSPMLAGMAYYLSIVMSFGQSTSVGFGLVTAEVVAKAWSPVIWTKKWSTFIIFTQV